ncbi:hypothetical protein Tco_0998344 [Tanacetum coccineum]
MKQILLASVDDSTLSGEAVTTASIDDSAIPTTNEEITLAQTLIQIKAAKPKVVTTAATTTTTTRPKARGDIKAKLDAELNKKSKASLGNNNKKPTSMIESWENTQAIMEAE